MITLLCMIFIFSLLGGFIKFAFSVTWGIMKVIGVILSVIAFPMLFIIVITVGVGAYLVLPLLLVGLAFGALAKA